MAPTLANGKICYIEIPATEPRRSSEFYEKVFGWRIRKRGDGAIAFDDATGEVSGTWVHGRPPATAPGLLIYIMVDSVAATIDADISHGGEVVQPIGLDAPEITARFRDPAGNVIGLYQEPGRTKGSVNESSWHEFIVSRVFDAPRDLVWKAWTRIVLVNSFSDEKGGLTRHPMSPTWPLEMLSTTTLTEHEGKTTITPRWAPLNPTEEERKTFDAAHEGMKQGWTGTFDQLAAYLKGAKA